MCSLDVFDTIITLSSSSIKVCLFFFCFRMYDFFMCFHKHDEEVALKILNILEEQGLHGYLEERDAAVVHSHIDNLESALTLSRKVIVLISGHSVEDSWFHFALQSSVLSGLANPVRRNCVIPVFHNIAQDQVPSILRSVHGIQYSDTRLFWHRLTSSVRHV